MEMYESEFPMPQESYELVEYILSKFEASCKDEEKNNAVNNDNKYGDKGVVVGCETHRVYR